MISRLGLRYRPTSQVDLEAHAGLLALLAEDLADVPPDLLEMAINRHVTSSPYMPKAADLVRIAKEIDADRRARTVAPTGRRTPQEHADELNANLTREDIEWCVNDTGSLYLRDKPSWSARRTVQLERQSEQDREDWKRAQRAAGNL